MQPKDEAQDMGIMSRKNLGSHTAISLMTSFSDNEEEDLASVSRIVNKRKYNQHSLVHIQHVLDPNYPRKYKYYFFFIFSSAPEKRQRAPSAYNHFIK